MSAKMGRPRLAKKDARGTFVSTRVSSPEYVEIVTAVKKVRKLKTEWVRDTLLTEARRICG
jgi:hypothetical protein